VCYPSLPGDQAVPATYRILSLDGGGIHGLLTARLLQQIDGQAPGFLKQANVFAGTSAGAIIALVLASSKPEERSARLNDCARLFSDPHLMHNSRIGYAQAVAGAGPLYAEEPWRRRVTALLGTGSRTLNNLLPANVIIPAFELDSGDPQHRNWRPRIFHNFNQQNPGHAEWFTHGGGDTRAIDVALRSSAAPIVTPVYQGFIDGGVFANNPSVCAIGVVLHHEENAGPDRHILQEINMVSVGSGQKRAYLRADPLGIERWGWFEWMAHPEHPLALVEVLFDSGSEVVDFQAHHLLGKQRYLRVDPPLSAGLGRVDFPSFQAVQMLERASTSAHANNVVDQTRTWLAESDWFPHDDAPPNAK
jgi:patatin-like phospholipase